MKAADKTRFPWLMFLTAQYIYKKLDLMSMRKPKPKKWGMRDVFATHAMGSIIRKWNGHRTYDELGNTYSDGATEAYKIADAMMKAREGI